MPTCFFQVKVGNVLEKNLSHGIRHINFNAKCLCVFAAPVMTLEKLVSSFQSGILRYVPNARNYGERNDAKA
jgi:hypothetical protein